MLALGVSQNLLKEYAELAKLLARICRVRGRLNPLQAVVDVTQGFRRDRVGGVGGGARLVQDLPKDCRLLDLILRHSGVPIPLDSLQVVRGRVEVGKHFLCGYKDSLQRRQIVASLVRRVGDLLEDWLGRRDG